METLPYQYLQLNPLSYLNNLLLNLSSISDRAKKQQFGLAHLSIICRVERHRANDYDYDCGNTEASPIDQAHSWQGHTMTTESALNKEATKFIYMV